MTNEIVIKLEKSTITNSLVSPLTLALLPLKNSFLLGTRLAFDQRQHQKAYILYRIYLPTRKYQWNTYILLGLTPVLTITKSLLSSPISVLLRNFGFKAIKDKIKRYSRNKWKSSRVDIEISRFILAKKKCREAIVKKDAFLKDLKYHLFMYKNYVGKKLSYIGD